MTGFSRLFAVLLAFVATGASLAACASETEDASEGEEDLGGVSEDALTGGRRTLAINEDPSVLVEHPETLAALEQKGFDLGSRLSGAAFADNRAFGASTEGKALVAAIDADVATAMRSDSSLGVGMAHVHRAFDTKWLRSSEAKFELVAVTNRMDLRFKDASGCGELHLVYRLAYKNATGASRLPMTIMLVYPQAREGAACGGVAQRWLSLPKGGAPDARAQALASGPLARAKATLASKIEIGFQKTRWPSSVRPDMGGHAEYGLRVFTRTASGLTHVPLENTPRTDLNADEKKALAQWVGANIPAIENGTAIVPSTFLAFETTSVAPKELARAANRPFAQLFGKEGEGLGALAGTSRPELVRRLDTMSCNGCHQSRSVAGFHILGNDRADMSVINALVDGISPHTRELVGFRKRDLESVGRSAGATPAVPKFPFAERGESKGGPNAACGLGGMFPGWTCAPGLVCSDVSGDDVGLCVTRDARDVGQACEESTVSFNPIASSDKNTGIAIKACSGATGAPRCNKSSGGFPNGLCSGPCATPGKVDGNGICGVAVPEGFNECVGAGRPFERCIAGGSKQLRRACDTTHPCGPDYVCAAVPNGPASTGACLPTYFMFQVRVDGHLVGN
jgi:hypothetical protein